MKLKPAEYWLVGAVPLMACGNREEFKQRLQWLSEGMLRNNLKPRYIAIPCPTEKNIYREFKRLQSLDAVASRSA